MSHCQTRRVVTQCVGGQVDGANYCSVTFLTAIVIILCHMTIFWPFRVAGPCAQIAPLPGTFLLKVKASNLYQNLNKVSGSNWDICMFLLTPGRLFDTLKRRLLAIIFNSLNIWCSFREARMPLTFPTKSDSDWNILYYILRSYINISTGNC